MFEEHFGLAQQVRLFLLTGEVISNSTAKPHARKDPPALLRLVGSSVVIE